MLETLVVPPEDKGKDAQLLETTSDVS